MTEAPTIVGIALRVPREGAIDGQLLAELSIQAGPVRIIGAVLIRFSDGDLRLLMPRAGRNRRVTVRSDYRPQMLEAALAAYRALDGAPAASPLATAPMGLGASGG